MAQIAPAPPSLALLDERETSSRRQAGREGWVDAEGGQSARRGAAAAASAAAGPAVHPRVALLTGSREAAASTAGGALHSSSIVARGSSTALPLHSSASLSSTSSSSSASSSALTVQPVSLASTASFVSSARHEAEPSRQRVSAAPAAAPPHPLSIVVPPSPRGSAGAAVGPVVALTKPGRERPALSAASSPPHASSSSASPLGTARRLGLSSAAYRLASTTMASLRQTHALLASHAMISAFTLRFDAPERSPSDEQQRHRRRPSRHQQRLPELEASFLHFYFHKYNASSRWSIVFSVIIWALFIINDVDKNAHQQRQQFVATVALRVVDCVVGLCCYAALGTSWLRTRATAHGGLYQQLLMFAGLMTFGVSQILFGVWQDNTLDPTYSMFMILIPSMSPTFFHQRFLFTCCFSGLLLLLFVVLTVACDAFTSAQSLITTVAGVGMANLLFCLFAYRRERQIREDFLSARQLAAEEAKSHALLANMMPSSAIRALRAGAEYIYHRHDNVSILFSHIVDFDDHTARLPPLQLVTLLNALFSRFDSLTDELSVYKVETIGDVFLVCSNCPVEYERPDHAQILCVMALEMMEAARHVRMEDGAEVKLKLGIHSGPVIAGVVGAKYPRFRLMGDSVNTASRMSTSCPADAVQLSPTSVALISSSRTAAGEPAFVCKERGPVAMKGKGRISTHFLLSHAYEYRTQHHHLHQHRHRHAAAALLSAREESDAGGGSDARPSLHHDGGELEAAIRSRAQRIKKFGANASSHSLSVDTRSEDDDVNDVDAILRSHTQTPTAQQHFASFVLPIAAMASQQQQQPVQLMETGGRRGTAMEPKSEKDAQQQSDSRAQIARAAAARLQEDDEELLTDRQALAGSTPATPLGPVAAEGSTAALLLHPFAVDSEPLAASHRPLSLPEQAAQPASAHQSSLPSSAAISTRSSMVDMSAAAGKKRTRWDESVGPDKPTPSASKRGSVSFSSPSASERLVITATNDQLRVDALFTLGSTSSILRPKGRRPLDFLTQRFVSHPALELQFRQWAWRQQARNSRFWVLFCVVAFIPLSVYESVANLDLVETSFRLQTESWLLRLVGVLAGGVYGWCSYQHFMVRWSQPLTAALLALEGMLFVYMAIMLDDYASSYGIGILLILLCIIQMFVHLRFLYALLSSTWILLFYVVASYAVNGVVPGVVLMLVAGNVMYAESSYWTEFLCRQDFIRRLKREQETTRTVQFLDNMLPAPVLQLIAHGDIVAQSHAAADVIFCDIVGFTSIASSLPAEDVVAVLNVMFSSYDALCTQHRVYKVETIGDCWMGCTGVVEKDADHSQHMVDFALAMLKSTRGFRVQAPAAQHRKDSDEQQPEQPQPLIVDALAAAEAPSPNARAHRMTRSSMSFVLSRMRGKQQTPASASLEEAADAASTRAGHGRAKSHAAFAQSKGGDTARDTMAVHPLVVRIGVHSGPVIAGVVGRKCARYHLFGHTVSVAEEMEQRGLAGKVVISEATRQSMLSSISRDRVRDYEIDWIEPLVSGEPSPPSLQQTADQPAVSDAAAVVLPSPSRVLHRFIIRHSKPSSRNRAAAQQQRSALARSSTFTGSNASSPSSPPTEAPVYHRSSLSNRGKRMALDASLQL